MAHNTRIRTAGLWTLASDVLPAEFEALDAAQFESINGDKGGTWAPSSQIVIGGAGLKISGPFDVPISTVTTFLGAVNFGATASPKFVAGSNTVVEAGAVWSWENAPVFTAGLLVSGGTATFSGALADFTTAATFRGVTAFDATSNVTFAAGGGFQVDSVAQFTDGMSVTGGVTDLDSPLTNIDGFLVISAGASMAGNFSLTGQLNEFADGRIRHRVVQANDTAGGNVSLGTQSTSGGSVPDQVGSIFRVGTASAPSGSYVVHDGTAGEWMIIRINAIANNIDVRREDNSLIVGNIDSSSLLWLMHNGSSWGVMQFEDTPGATF